MSVCMLYGFIPARPSLGAAFASTWLNEPVHVAHIAGNLLVLAVLGVVIEPVLGHARFAALFLLAGLAGTLPHMLVEPGSLVPLVGMSGNLTGLMAVGAAVRPRMLLSSVASYITLNLVALYVATPLLPPGTSVGAHIGGSVCGVLVVLMGRAA